MGTGSSSVTRTYVPIYMVTHQTTNGMMTYPMNLRNTMYLNFNIGNVGTKVETFLLHKLTGHELCRYSANSCKSV